MGLGGAGGGWGFLLLCCRETKYFGRLIRGQGREGWLEGGSITVVSAWLLWGVWW